MNWEPWTAEDFVKIFNLLKPELIPYFASHMDVYGLELEHSIPEPEPDPDSFTFTPKIDDHERRTLEMLSMVLKYRRPPLAEVNSLLAPKGVRFLIVKYEKQLIVP
jgi:hypothetical protein